MVFKVIDWDWTWKWIESWVRNTIQEKDFIIPPEIQVHIDAILADTENCLEYVARLDAESRQCVLRVFKQI